MELAYTIGLYGGARREMEDAWRLTRTLREGTDGMRREAGRYTPRTVREAKQPALYAERLAASVLYNVYEETITRIAALPFEKPPVVVGDLPPELEAIKNDADRCGNSLSVFLAQVYQDAIDKGMGMFLVDHVSTIKDDGTVMRADEADEEDVRPYFSRIDPDNYIGCKYRVSNGREVCTELRVREWAYKSASDGLGEELVEYVRRWTQTDVEVWERNYGSTSASSDRQAMAGQGDTSGFALVSTRPHNFPDNRIPLVVVYTRKRGFMHARPPLLGLAHLNVKHWNQQSIHDNALRYCMSPVLFGKGFTRTEQEQKPATGEGATMISTSEQAQLGFVEIAGTSLEQSSKQIDKTEMRMRAAAVEPLMAGASTATGEMRAELKDQSEAQRWVEGMEWAAFHAFKLAARWVGYDLPDDFNVTLHRASSLLQAANPARTAALQNDAQNGRLTLATYLKERARSGDFADDFDPEAEAEAIEQEKVRSVERQMQALASQIESERPDEEDDGEQEADEADDDQPQPGQPAPNTVPAQFA